MKNVMKFTILLALLSFTTGIYASMFEQNFEDRLPIEKFKTSNESSVVIIRNKRGTAVYETKVSATNSKETVVRNINLPDGTYAFEVIEDSKVKITPFIVTEGTIVIDEENTKTVFKPTIRVKDDLLLVNQLSLQEEPLNVTIYYSENGLNLNAFGEIQTDKIKSGTILQKAYKLDKTKTGSYMVKLISEGKVFTEVFNF